MATDWQKFLIEMSALSTASQTATEHLAKNRWSAQLCEPKVGKEEERRVFYLHIISGFVGALLAYTCHLHPIQDLSGDTTVPVPVEYGAVVFLVSFGSGLFNDLLTSLRAFGDAQKSLKEARASFDEKIVDLSIFDVPTAVRAEDEDPFDLRYFTPEEATA